MQKPIVPILVLLILSLGGFAVYQQSQIRHQAEKISALDRVISSNQNAARNDLKKAQLEIENQAFQEESAELRKKLTALAQVESLPEPTPDAVTPAASPAKNPFQGMMDKMMKDPKMRAAIAAQQMAIFKPMYADFLKQQRLSETDTDKFFQLLAQQTEKGMEAGLKMMSGEKKPGDVAQTFSDTSEEMKALLGESGFKQYEEYQKSIPDRLALNQISMQMGARQMPLRPDQSAGMLQIMQQEKLNTAQFSKAQPNLSTSYGLPEESVMNDSLKAQEERNARILARSQTLLTPDQWKAFGEQQKQAMEMQKMGMEMARGMFPEAKK